MILRNKSFRLLVLFIAVACRLNAQAVDKSVLEKYDAGVVASLFSIVKYVNIDAPLQLQLAQTIHDHDSTIKNWISLGKSTANIDTLQQLARFKLLGMLSQQQLQTYKYNSNIEISNAIAAGEAEYIQKEYKPDSATYNEIRKSISNKYNYILQNFSDNYFMNHEAAIDYLKKIEGIYDEYKYFPVLYSRKFIASFTGKLSSIKKIPVQTLDEIQHSFYNLVWQNKYVDWTLAAENATRKHITDTTLFASLHRSEFEKQSDEALITEKYNMAYNDHVSEDAFKNVSKLVKEKHFKKFVLQSTYAQYNTQLYENLLRETMKYYDSAIRATLIYDGSLQPSTQFAIALKYKKQLNLRQTLCDTLVRHAMYLEKQRDSILFIDPFASIDFGEYETQYLSRLLTEDQYNTVLFHKNRTYAAANALADWQEMVIRGLDRGFLKEQSVKQMTDFYIVKNGAWCRYANDKIRLWSNLRALDEVKPQVLKILDPIRWSGATEKATNNLQLQW